MSDAGFFKGTSTEQDSRFSNAQKKMMKTMRFAEGIDKKVDMSKVNLDVIKPWIAKRMMEILDVDDDVVVDFAMNQLEEKHPDPKLMQINMTGFLGGQSARIFIGQLWGLLGNAQETEDGIPPELVEMKMQELRDQKAADERLREKIRQKEEEIRKAVLRQKDGSEQSDDRSEEGEIKGDRIADSRDSSGRDVRHMDSSKYPHSPVDRYHRNHSRDRRYTHRYREDSRRDINRNDFSRRRRSRSIDYNSGKRNYQNKRHAYSRSSSGHYESRVSPHRGYRASPSRCVDRNKGSTYHSYTVDEERYANKRRVTGEVMSRASEKDQPQAEAPSRRERHIDHDRTHRSRESQEGKQVDRYKSTHSGTDKSRRNKDKTIRGEGNSNQMKSRRSLSDSSRSPGHGNLSDRAASNNATKRVSSGKLRKDSGREEESSSGEDEPPLKKILEQERRGSDSKSPVIVLASPSALAPAKEACEPVELKRARSQSNVQSDVVMSNDESRPHSPSGRGSNRCSTSPGSGRARMSPSEERRASKSARTIDPGRNFRNRSGHLSSRRDKSRSRHDSPRRYKAEFRSSSARRSHSADYRQRNRRISSRDRWGYAIRRDDYSRSRRQGNHQRADDVPSRYGNRHRRDSPRGRQTRADSSDLEHTTRGVSERKRVCEASAGASSRSGRIERLDRHSSSNLSDGHRDSCEQRKISKEIMQLNICSSEQVKENVVSKSDSKRHNEKTARRGRSDSSSVDVKSRKRASSHQSHRGDKKKEKKSKRKEKNKDKKRNKTSGNQSTSSRSSDDSSGANDSSANISDCDAAKDWAKKKRRHHKRSKHRSSRKHKHHKHSSRPTALKPEEQGSMSHSKTSGNAEVKKDCSERRRSHSSDMSQLSPRTDVPGFAKSSRASRKSHGSRSRKYSSKRRKGSLSDQEEDANTSTPDGERELREEALRSMKLRRQRQEAESHSRGSDSR